MSRLCLSWPVVGSVYACGLAAPVVVHVWHWDEAPLESMQLLLAFFALMALAAASYCFATRSYVRTVRQCALAVVSISIAINLASLYWINTKFMAFGVGLHVKQGANLIPSTNESPGHYLTGPWGLYLRLAPRVSGRTVVDGTGSFFSSKLLTQISRVRQFKRDPRMSELTPTQETTLRRRAGAALFETDSQAPNVVVVAPTDLRLPDSYWYLVKGAKTHYLAAAPTLRDIGYLQ